MMGPTSKELKSGRWTQVRSSSVLVSETNNDTLVLREKMVWVIYNCSSGLHRFRTYLYAKAGNSYWKGRINTIDLLVITSSDQLPLIPKISTRRSTVLSLSPSVRDLWNKMLDKPTYKVRRSFQLEVLFVCGLTLIYCKGSFLSKF